MRLSLSKKVLALVSVILLSEIFFVLAVASLQDAAEKEAARASRSAKISETINRMLSKVYDIYAIVQNGEDHYFNFDKSYYQEQIDDFKALIHELKDMVKDIPGQKRIVARADDSLSSALVNLEELSTRPAQRSEWTPEFKSKRKGLWREVRKKLDVLRDIEFKKLHEAEKAIASESPEKLAQYRQQMKAVLYGGLAFMAVLSIGLALYLVRTITDRIKIMNENTVKLASGHPLHARLYGNDEIADLDRFFHAMALELKDAERKETAVLDNVKDLVCSIDNQGRFSALNRAANTILGVQQDELLGSHFIDLVEQEDAAAVLGAIDEIKAGGQSRPFEARLRRGRSGYIQTLWSAHWSPEEQSLFCVIHDISERKDLERLKQELNSMITHDLRTPLNSISVYLEMIETGMLGGLNEKGQDLTKTAARSADRMMVLINDLLDVEKMKSGTMEIHTKKLEVAQLFQQATHHFAAVCQTRTISIAAAETDAHIVADEDKILRVLQNLIANAIKFSPDGERIFLKAEKQNGLVEISVADRGAGIPAGSVSRVFDRFQQAHSSNSGAEGGSGLGLTICKAIVELHGGEIRVESEEGVGTTFYFTIPHRTVVAA